MLLHPNGMPRIEQEFFHPHGEKKKSTKKTLEIKKKTDITRSANINTPPKSLSS